MCLEVMASLSLLIFLFSSILFLSSSSHAQTSPPLVQGLSFTFYRSSCPNVETIVRNELRKVYNADIGQAAGVLRIHFHDCFVQGCDASLLLDGSASGPSEKNAPPNLTLRPQAFKIINDLRAAIEKSCRQVVSCADIVALAARDSIFLAGGPNYRVPLGRRDGLSFATRDATLDNLPGPLSNASELLDALSKKNLDATDLVALSGTHTIGISHCTSFENRLYPTQDPTLDQTFARRLYNRCPALNSTNTTNLDLRSPNVFDNKYYVDLMNRQGLLTSDQTLYTDRRTRPIVTSFAVNQTLFFEKVSLAMVKMGQMSVLTGTQGEIRTNCSALNPVRTILSTVVDGNDGTNAAF
ncbi:peroxidase 12-like [Magnolia sinica]|uniref:peroxidase 12-like n=1 Tax=Magnolia sinica TaxID=86752 RepID=UPI002659C1D8|nr:peroxidase 12-like [Magnolia sinica]